MIDPIRSDALNKSAKERQSTDICQIADAYYLKGDDDPMDTFADGIMAAYDLYEKLDRLGETSNLYEVRATHALAYFVGTEDSIRDKIEKLPVFE